MFKVAPDPNIEFEYDGSGPSSRNRDNTAIDVSINTTLQSRQRPSLSRNDDDEIPLFQQRRSHGQRTIINSNPHESLDYDVCENELWAREQNTRDSFTARKDFARWMIFILIGVCTALIACIVDISVEELSRVKHTFMAKNIQENILAGDLVISFLYYTIINSVLVAIGAVLVTYIEPIASGSGIPIIKCYLNGVKVPRVVRIKTLFVKVIGVIMSVTGGLAGGKEGPMIHAGAVVAAGISQGKSTTFRRDFRCFHYFRNDHEKRDFVVGGASAGVAAAFGAPLGGVLFALEEGASFWNQALIWRTMIASIISSFVLNVILSAYHGLKTFSYPGLFNLGEFEPLPYEYFEIPIFVLMGIFGGLSGALWNFFNIRLSIFRKDYLKPKWSKVIEAILITILTASCTFIMITFINDCRPLGVDPTINPIQLFCDDNQYNVAASLWFQTPEKSVKSLFHDPPGSYELMTLVIFLMIYYPLSCLTFGLSVSIGIFIPTLLVGAAWGRITAMGMAMIFPQWTFIHPSKYALIGAAAQLGGCLRMTISLTVILIESTGNISFGLPLIITLISAKWMGDYFNEGIYDTIIRVSNVPMLPWHVNDSFKHFLAHKIMNDKPICFRAKERCSYILETLRKCSHNGFPVVDQVSESDRNNGPLKGFILRHQLIVILKNKYFEEKKRFWIDDVSIENFRDEYPRYPSIKDIKLSPDKTDYTVNLDLFMNPTPYTVTEHWSVPRVFQTFRALGLRHIVVVDIENKVCGIITRKDFLEN